MNLIFHIASALFLLILIIVNARLREQRNFLKFLIVSKAFPKHLNRVVVAEPKDFINRFANTFDIKYHVQSHEPLGLKRIHPLALFNLYLNDPISSIELNGKDAFFYFSHPEMQTDLSEEDLSQALGGLKIHLKRSNTNLS